MLRFIRWFLGKIILAWDAAFPPKRATREPAAQARVDALGARLALYQFAACPFCVKVRRATRRMGIDVPLRDALGDPRAREELLREGGSDQVPCLKIREADGKVRWLYESSDIIAYLDREISSATGAQTA